MNGDGATGVCGPHSNREVELLLAGEKPAALVTVYSTEAADLDRVRAAGLLVEEEWVAKAKPAAPGQLQLDLGERALRTWPREARIARGPDEMAALVHAWEHGTHADLGRALGYSDDDIAAWYRMLGVEWSPASPTP